MQECRYKDDILEMKGDIKEIHKDVRSLLKFRWHITGVVVGVSAAFAIIFNVLSVLGQ